MPSKVNIHEAKTHLSRLLARVEQGEEIIIARAGAPIARLVPFAGSRPDRQPGTARESLRIATDFDEPLPDAILRKFER